MDRRQGWPSRPENEVRAAGSASEGSFVVAGRATREKEPV
jgi:hypothetical protein